MRVGCVVWIIGLPVGAADGEFEDHGASNGDGVGCSGSVRASDKDAELGFGDRPAVRLVCWVLGALVTRIL